MISVCGKKLQIWGVRGEKEGGAAEAGKGCHLNEGRVKEKEGCVLFPDGKQSEAEQNSPRC